MLHLLRLVQCFIVIIVIILCQIFVSVSLDFYLRPDHALQTKVPLTAAKIESEIDGDSDNFGVWVPETNTADGTTETGEKRTEVNKG